MHEDDGEGQRAPDIGHGDGVERGVGIAGPVHGFVDQSGAEQDPIQEAELEAVEERPDQPITDRRDGVGQQDQESRDTRGPHAGLVDQERDCHGQHDLARHGNGGEDQRVLDGDPEQRILEHALVVLPAAERELAAPELGEADLVEREVARIDHRKRQDQPEEQQGRQVHGQRELPRRQFAPQPGPAPWPRERLLGRGRQGVRPCAWRRRCP